MFLKILLEGFLYVRNTIFFTRLCNISIQANPGVTKQRSPNSTFGTLSISISITTAPLLLSHMVSYLISLI